MILLSSMIQFNQMTELWILVSCPNRVAHHVHTLSFFEEFEGGELDSTLAFKDWSSRDICSSLDSSVSIANLESLDFKMA